MQLEQSRRRIRIGDLLVENRIISEAQLQAALQEQKRSGHKLGNTLVELGYIEEIKLLTFLSQQLKVPYIDLQEYELNPEAAQALPEVQARRHRVLVLEVNESEALVGMADPTDLHAYDYIGKLLKRHVKQAVVRESDLLIALDMVYQHTDELTNLAGELGDELSQSDIDLGAMMESVADSEAPVFRLLQTLFEDAVKAKASDIHIEPDEDVLRVRQRVDGVLQEHVMNEIRIAPALVQRLKLLANLDISEKRLPQDGRFQIKIKKHSMDVRLSTMPTRHGEVVVMRLLDQSSGMLTLGQLGIQKEMLKQIRAYIHRPHGLVLVTGPTGSGKTTTLYAALQELNVAEKKIITVEDPVEYSMPRINQVQVNSKIDLNFGRVLRTALRQDPDILLVGEMRDEETAQIGLRAAITGHLVLSTLHTNSSISTISRLIDMGIPGYLIASALLCVVAQRLMRKICPNCKEELEPDGQQQAWLEGNGDNIPAGAKFYHGKGCKKCHDRGYSGRIGVYELLQLDGDLLYALRAEDIHAFSEAAARSESFRPLGQAALDYALEGITTLEEVISIAGDSDN
jgi:MSHA biogenesis protein MshE